MKKIMLIPLALILILTMSLNCFANVKDFDSASYKNDFNKSTEYSKVQKIIEKSGAKELIMNLKGDLPSLDLIKSADELSYGIPYKVVIVQHEGLLNAIKSNKKLCNELSKLDYMWEIPIIEKNNIDNAVGSFAIEKVDNNWAVTEIGGYLPEEEIIYSSKKAEIERSIENNNIKKVESYIHVRVLSIKKDYLVIASNDEESFIGIKSLKDNDSKKLKKKDVAKKEIEKKVKEYKLYSSKSGTFGGGGNIVENIINSSTIISISIISLLIMCTVSIFIFKKRFYNMKV